MKLRTEMKRDTDGEWFANDPDPNQCKGAIARDAVVAHALMQAIHSQCGRDTRRFVLDRADGIMAQWGFDSEEAE